MLSSLSLSLSLSLFPHLHLSLFLPRSHNPYNTHQQLHPQSLQLYELMCWCWSDKPQHRPTFDEILKLIKTDSFSHLLEATPVTRDHDDITAACINCSSKPNTMSAFHTMSVSPGMGTRSDTTLSYHTVMSMLSTSSSSPQEDTNIQVWYGTEHGKCGVVNFHKSTTNLVRTSII